MAIDEEKENRQLWYLKKEGGAAKKDGLGEQSLPAGL
jgi:hypothetical protein